VLSCGIVVEGEPHDTDAYRATARELGYGDDTRAMCRDHDPLHQSLAQWLGFRDSFALRCAAGLRQEDEISAAEERAVLAVQRFLQLTLQVALRSNADPDLSHNSLLHDRTAGILPRDPTGHG
jgi:hypothetical protein